MLPFVSVIIPVYNDSKRLILCVRALFKQNYPRELYEIIVVDNNSTDDLETVLQNNDIVFLQEINIKSSYAARNKGIRIAKGDIFAFTDSDCIPSENWISEGVNALEDSSVDLISGNVRFLFSSGHSVSEIFDSIFNMQIKYNIEENNISKTVNLFVKRHVFDQIGLFPSDTISGGDVIWTQKATENGFRLGYKHSAEVSHPSRSFGEMIKKSFRVGKGYYYMWKKSNRSVFVFILKNIRRILPPSIQYLSKLLRRNQLNLSKNKLLKMYFIYWVCQITVAWGCISDIFLKKMNK